MAEISGELKEKLMKAQSPEEVTELLKAEGRNEIRAERIWEDLSRLRAQESQEVSLDELEAVSGGAVRDWMKEGCAASVEPRSSCWGTDNCPWVGVRYDHSPTDRYRCPKCGGFAYLAFEGTEQTRVGCYKCGRFVYWEWTKKYEPYTGL